MSNNSFDERAASWDEPAKVERAEAIADSICAAINLDPTVRMLEYGAGTGLLTQALRDRVGPVTLVDSSVGMRQVMEQKIANHDLLDARIGDTDLLDMPTAEKFDLITAAMVLHHIADTSAVLANFARILEAGGHVAIADLDAEDGSFHDETFEGHHGFDREDLSQRLEEVGFDQVSVKDCYQIERDGKAYGIFLATGRKA